MTVVVSTKRNTLDKSGRPQETGKDQVIAGGLTGANASCDECADAVGNRRSECVRLNAEDSSSRYEQAHDSGGSELPLPTDVVVRDIAPIFPKESTME